VTAYEIWPGSGTTWSEARGLQAHGERRGDLIDRVVVVADDGRRGSGGGQGDRGEGYRQEEEAGDAAS